jgi:hypothetical protein
MRLEQDANVERICVMGPPSETGKTSAFAKTNGSPDYLFHNLRPADASGPPITLFHPVFAEFKANLTRELEIDNSFLESVIEATVKFSDFYKDESHRRSLAEPFFCKLFDQASICEVPLKTNGKLDGVIWAPNLVASTVIFEWRSEVGSGGTDPLNQNAIGYGRFWAQEEVSCRHWSSITLTLKQTSSTTCVESVVVPLFC